MKPQTRQTLIGVAGQTAVALVAIDQGVNGSLLMVYMLSVGGVLTPEVLEALELWSNK